MPPQVNGAGPGKRPVVVRSQDGVDQKKSGNVNKKPAENQQNTTTPSEPHRATTKEKSQKKLEMSMGNSWFTELAKALGEMENKQAEKVIKKAEKVKANPKDLEKIEDLKGTSQEMSTISGAFNEAVKTIGNAVSNSARKQ
jgi:hypothetical protein